MNYHISMSNYKSSLRIHKLIIMKLNLPLVPLLAGEVGGVEEEGAVNEDGGGPLALKFLLYLRLTSFPVWYAG